MKQRDTCFYKGICLFCLCIGLLYGNNAFSQQDDLSIKAKELIYVDPNEAIKIAEHILNTEKEPQEKALLNMLLAKSYLVKGDYNKAITYAFDKNNLLEEIAVESKIEINILKSELLRKLYLNKQSSEYLLKAEKLIAELTNNQSHIELQSQIDLEHIKLQLDNHKNNESLTSIEDIESNYKDFIKTNIITRRELYLVKEKAFSNLTEYDSATIYLDSTLTLLGSIKMNNTYVKANIYIELGYLNLQKKLFKESEEALFIALRFAEIIENPVLLMQVNKDLAINYLASNQKSKHKVYYDEFLVLNSEVELMEQESVNTLYNILSNQETEYLNDEESKYSGYLFILLSSVLLIFLIGVFILIKSEGKKKRLREIINYLEISRTNFIKIKPSKKTTTKRIIIPEETEKALLLKLKRFGNSHKYLNKEMSLAVLAGQFETNTKYLSEIINRHYNYNFNTFINKLRIDYIIDKLKNETNYINYKISFLADESGFSSHSSFATVFKTIIGMSPATFINLIKEEREELKFNNIDK